MSHVTCHMSYVTCHMSHCACHMSYVKCLCLYSKVTVYRWKCQCVFWDLLLITLSSELRVHRAGSQLKMSERQTKAGKWEPGKQSGQTKRAHPGVTGFHPVIAWGFHRYNVPSLPGKRGCIVPSLTLCAYCVIGCPRFLAADWSAWW